MNSNNYCPDRLPCGICKQTYTQCMNPNYGIKITTTTDGTDARINEIGKPYLRLDSNGEE